MNYLSEINSDTPEFGDLYDELPLWSARFGIMLLDLVQFRPNMTILDVGAGTGFLSIELAQRCGSGAMIIAVDPWEAAISRLTRKLNHLGIRNVRTMVQDAATINTPDSSVDLIVSNLGINNFDDPQTTLRTCFRVAKPGAKLYLTTNLVGHMCEFYEAYRGVLVELGFAEKIAELNSHINHRATVESVNKMLEREGFRIVEVVTDSFRERFSDGSALLRHYFIRLGFLPAWKSIAPKDSVERIFEAIERRLNSIAAEHGELSLSIPTACIIAQKAVHDSRTGVPHE